MTRLHLLLIGLFVAFIHEGFGAPPACTMTLNSGGTTKTILRNQVACVPSGSTFSGSILVRAGGTIVICKSSFTGSLTIDPAWHIYPAGRWYDSPSTSYTGTISNNGIRSRSASNCVTCSTPSKGSITTPAPICAGSSTSIIGSNVAGANYQWRIQSSGGSWSDFGSNSRNLSSTGNLTSTTQFARRTYDCSPRKNSGWNFVTVTVNPLPSAVIAAPVDLTCTTTSQVLDGSGSTGSGVTYAWSTGDGIITANGTTNSATINAAGTYRLTVTNTTTGCTDFSEVTVSEDLTTPIAAIAAPADLTCSTTSQVLDGSGSTGTGVTYAWSTGDGSITANGTTNSATISTAGTYRLTVTNTTTGCTDFSEVTVSEDLTTPTASIAAPVDLTCTTTSQVLDGSGSTGSGVTYAWSTGDGSITANGTTNSATIGAAGTYRLTVTNTITGCTDFSEVTVSEDLTTPTASIAAPVDLTCITTSQVLDGSGSTGTGVTYAWSTGDGSITANGTTNSATLSTAGTYRLTVTNTTTGCTDFSEVTVSEDLTTPTASIAAPVDLTCTTTSQVLDGSGSTGTGVTYAWSTGDGSITANGTTNSATISTAGTYRLTVTNSTTGCTDFSEVTVSEDLTTPTASIAAPVDLTCITTSQVLDGSGSTGSGVTYSWSTGDGSITANGTTNSATIGAAGTYRLTVTNTITGCTDFSEVTVSEDLTTPTASIAAPVDLTCTTTSQVLDGSGSTGTGVTYAWSTGDGSITANGTTNSATISTAGTYRLTVTNSTTGCTDFSEVTVSEDLTTPTSSIAAPVDLTCTTTSQVLDGSGSTGTGVTYAWSTGDGSITANGTTNSATISTAGTYRLTVTNSTTGCTDFSEVTVSEDLTTPTASIAAPVDLTCTTTSQVLDGSGSTGSGVTYAWSTGDGSITANGTTNSATIGATGTYRLTVTNTTTGCTDFSEVTVSEDLTTPNLTVVDPGAVCAPNTVDITSGGVQTTNTGTTTEYYTTQALADAGAGSDIGTPTGVVAGTYYIRSEFATGCYVTEEVTVTVNTTPLADAPANVEACDSYTLPALTNGSYFLTTGGVNPAGATVTTTDEIFVFSGGTGSCPDVENSFDVTINTTPLADAPSNVEACDSYTLPALTNGSYFLTTGGVDPAGATVTTTDEIFVFSGGTGSCPDVENSFDVTINTTPLADAPSNVEACDSYTLPALTNGSYFLTTGGVDPAGATVTTTDEIFVFSGGTGSCLDVENSFDVTINTTPLADAPVNAEACDSYTLPALTNGSYFLTTGGVDPAGATVTTTDEIFVYSGGTGSCPDVENSFDLTINTTPLADAPVNAEACDSYTLPALTNGSYFLTTGGVDPAGATVTTTDEIFVFSGGTGSCLDVENSFDVTINTTPLADAPVNAEACDSYTLPALTNGSYFLTTGGVDPAGATVTTTDEIFVFSGGSGSCPDVENSFDVTINTTPSVDDITDQVHCDTYELPTITGTDLTGTEAYYTSSNGGGTKYVAGDDITATIATLYIYDETGTTPNCLSEEDFSITINTTPSITAVKTDPTICGGADGIITITGLLSSTSYDWTYDTPASATVTGTSSSDGSGDLEIANALTSGSYPNISVTLNSCTSNVESVSLNDPSAPIVDALADQESCDSYVLPSITGTNLTGNEAYFTGTNGTGTKYASGATVTIGGTYYLLDTTVATPSCKSEQSFLLTINTTPLADAPANAEACDSYTLPALTNGSYFLTTGGVDPAGATVTTTDEIFVYSGGTGSCPDVENSFDVTINTTPLADAPVNAEACDSYTLPALTNGSYFLTTGGVDPAGATVTTTDEIFVYSGGTGSCPDVENSFDVTINTTPLADAPVNAEACDSYTLPALTNGSYFLTTGGVDPAGATVTTTDEIFVFSGGTGSCPDVENSFDVTINTTPSVDDITDQVHCDTYELPTITGTDLTGTEAYYTGAGGTGTKYVAGDDITSTIATLYIYDETGTTPNCLSEEDFSITINTTPSITAVKTDPTICGGADGIITITGLLASTSYDWTYDTPASATVTGTSSSDGSGDLEIANALTSGSYPNISVTLNSCTSNVESITLIDPSAPIVDDLADQESCDSYVLPSITGTNLTGNEAYFTGTNGTGTKYASGATVTIGGTYYLLDTTVATPSCKSEQSFLLTINTTPLADAPVNAEACDSYTLPALTNGSYFLTTGGVDPAGATVTTTDEIFVYSGGTGSCPDVENSFDLTINTTPLADAPVNAEACDSYTLPALTNGSYFLTTGGVDPAGATVTTTDEIFVYSGGTGSCPDVENSFDVTINTTPLADAPVNAEACDSYTLPSLTNGSYFLTTGGVDPAGATVTTTDEIFVYSAGTGSCPDVENSFDVTINTTPSVDDIVDQVHCDTYELPTITGTDLTGTEAYYTSSNGGGTKYVAGDDITATIATLYIYDETGTTPNCLSEEDFSITINTTPSITAVKTDPTICGGADGIITITGLLSSTSYDWTYDTPASATVTGTSSSDGSGDLEIANALTSGSYPNISVTLNSCTSNVESVSLNDPSAPIVDALADQESCDSYVLPSITGTNLTGNEAYFTGTNGTGTKYASGATVTIGGTYYLLDTTVATPSCKSEQSFLLTINTTPLADAPANAEACDSYTLPALTNGSYFLTTGGVDPAGATVTTTDEIFVYSGGTGSCPDVENSFDVTINTTPLADAPVNAEACDSYTLPALTNGSYFLTTGGVDPAGATVTTTDEIFVYSGGTGSCPDVENSFDVTINTTPLADAPVNAEACDSYTLPSLTNGSYFLTTGGVDPAGATVTTTDEIFVFSGGSGSCPDVENSFDVTINTTPSVDDIVDQVHCDTYELPTITGTDLTGTEAYYTSSNGGGTKYVAGDDITATIATLYIYDETGTTPNCLSEEDFSITINTTPSITAVKTDPTICGGADGIITITGLLSSTSYDWTYDTPASATVTGTSSSDGSGDLEIANALTSGSYPNISVTLNSCTSNVESVSLNDPSAPIVDALADQESCDSYVLPSITGTNLTGNEAYFTGTNGTGTKYASGATVTIGGTYYLLDTTVATPSCKSEQSFLLTINTTPLADAPVNAEACDSYTLPALTNGSYFLTTGGVDPAGATVTTTDEIFVYSGGTGSCPDVENSFDLTINTTPLADAPVNAEACDSYTLPALTNGSYFLTTGGVDPAGATVTTTDEIFVYSGGTGSCPDVENSFDVTINTTPLADAPVNAEACDSYTLPSLTNGSYFLTTGGVDPAGATVTTTDEIFVYSAGTGSCPDVENSFDVTINTTPSVDDIVDQVHCDTYELPTITGTDLTGTEAYYTSSNGGGTKYVAGDDITATIATLYIYDETGTTPNCLSEEDFSITINTTPSITAVKTDPTICGGADGIITITGLLSSTSYDWTYDTPASATVTGTSSSDGSGDLEIANALTSGSYPNISVTLNSCTSNVESVSLNDPSAPIVDALADQESCDSYVLPSITGTNLTGNEAYFTGTNGTGTKYASGATVTIGGTYYLLDTTVATPSCKSEQSFLLTINTTPLADAPVNAEACDSYTLPALTNGSYFLTTGGVDPAGATVTTTDEIFVYSGGTGSCPDVENSFDLTINTTPLADAPVNAEACDSYTLPALTNGSYFLTTGGVDPAGATVTTTDEIFVYSGGTGSCPDVENSFDVTINTTPLADAPVNAEACDSYTLPSLTNGSYFLTTGGVDPAGATVTTTDEIFVFSGGSGSCPDVENSFDVTINTTPSVDDITDQVHCDTYELPTITGTDLTGTEAYYTSSNGGGTKYVAGDDITATIATLYIYDETGTTPNCLSEEDFSITINTTPSITAVKTDPTICGGADGIITITGLLSSTSYDWTYDTPASATVTGTSSSDGSGDLEIANALTSGSYPNISVTLNSCTSNVESVSLNDPSAPIVDALADQESCDSYVLPSITGTNLTGNEAYFTGTNGTGTKYASGATVTIGGTYYLLDTTVATPSCKSEQSFLLTINTTPLADAPVNAEACDSYTLPALTNGSYFLTTGGVDPAGATVTTTDEIFVYSGGTGSCPDVENSFDLTINTTPLADAPVNAEACDSYTLPALTNGSYFLTTGGVDPAGATVTTTDEIFVYSGGTGSCPDVENSFDVTINTTPLADAPVNAEACDSYTLPSLTNGSYFLTTGGVDPAGATVTTTDEIFVFSGGSGSCPDVENSFDVTINTTPSVDDITDQVHCDTYELPTITGTDLTGTEAYYTSSNGGGTKYVAGDDITATIATLYIYDETGTTPNCLSEEDFSITINTTPSITAVKTDPTICGGADGIITITGLLSSTSYDWTYDTPASATVTGTSSSDGSGELEVSNALQSGAYSNISVTLNNCTSNVESITLIDPSAPVVNDLPDVTVCDSLELPAITGANMTDNEAYYTGTNGTGTRYVAGDYVSASGTYFIMDSTVATPTCKTEELFVLDVQVTPEVDDIVNVTSCDSYSLPTITGTNLTGNEAYFTGAGGTGTKYVDTDVINASIATLYIYDETASTPNCTSEEDFAIKIETTPTVDDIADQEHCDTYTLPTITGTALTGNEAYYTGIGGTGTKYVATDVITSSIATLYIYDSTTSTPTCNDQEDFSITINVTPTVDDIANLTSCDTYTLLTITGSNLTGNEAYFTGAGGTGTKYVATDIISSSIATLYIYDETATTPNCTDEEDFAINIEITPDVDDLADMTVCDSLELPAITGTNLTGVEAYYTGINGTGTRYNPGDYLSSATTYYIYDSTNSSPTCFDQESFVLTITLTPVITLAKSDPITCGGTDGSITAEGLVTGENYTWYYDDLKSTTQSGVANAIAPGEVTVSNSLGAGSYTNIYVDYLGCISNSLDTSLFDPKSPEIDATFLDPDCVKDNGEIYITGLTNGYTYGLTYTGPSGVVNTTGTPVTDTIFVTGLAEGQYTNIVIDSNNCTDTYMGPIDLVNPIDPTISAYGIEPTCALGDGQLIVKGLDETYANYILSYNSAIQVNPLTVVAGGHSTIVPNLNQGNYNNIQIDSLGCLSNTINVTLTDPKDPVITAYVIEPTCALGDGQLIVQTLDNAFIDYILTYNDGAVQTVNNANVVFDSITVTNLSEGTITGIQIDSLGCTSNTLSVTLTNPVFNGFDVTTTEPTCILGDGIITVRGLAPNTAYDFTYTHATQGGLVTWNETTDGTGNYTLGDTLSAGSYTNIIVDSLGCDSTEAGPFVLTDPVNPMISVSGTGPTRCFGTDGTITVEGLSAGFLLNYVRYLDQASTNQEDLNVTVNGSGNVVISGNIPKGTYSDIYVDSLGCISNMVEVTLEDPKAPEIKVATIEPTCALNDGQFVITGLAIGATVDLHVEYPSTTRTAEGSYTVDANGEIILTGYSEGTYAYLEVDSMNCKDIEGPFTFTDPVFAGFETSSVEPTCALGDGIINLINLAPNTTYEYSYTHPVSGVVGATPFTTDGNGEFQLSNLLVEGSYTNIIVDSLGCDSTKGPITLTNPVFAGFETSFLEPTCALGDGIINMINLAPNTAYEYTYIHPVSGVVGANAFTTDTNGEFELSNALVEGTYTNIIVDSLGCDSTKGPITLTNPVFNGFDVTTVEPTCALGDGQIRLVNLAPNADYIYQYTHPVSGVQGFTNFITDASGVYLISDTLSDGSYTPFTVDSLGCDSTEVGPFVLTDPLPPTISSSYLEPTCSFDDGEIYLFGLSNSFTYEVYYNAANQGTETPVDDTLKLAPLLAGTYSDIYVDSLGCLSNRLTEVLRDPIPPSIEVTYKDPDCVKDNGEVYIHGLSNGYEYTFFSEGTTKIAPVTPVNGTPSNDTVQFIGISAGTITSITVDSLGCRDTFDVGFELVNPLNPTITVEGRSPSKCDGADGALVIKGVSVGFDYLVSLDSAGTTFYDNISEEALFLPGELLIENLYEGEYNNIRVDSLGCVSNLLSSTLVDPLMPSISASLLGRDSICMGWDTELQLVLGFIDPDVSWKWQYNNHSNGSGFSDLPEFDGDLTPKHIPDSTGEYRSVVTYGFCKDTTSTLFVEVQPNFTPRVMIAADASHLCEDDQFIFRVVEDNVRDSLGLHSFYQWNTGGERIHGAIRSDYYLENSQYPKTGDHFVALMTPDPGPYSFLCTTSTTAFSNVVEIRVDRLPEVGVLDVNATEICFQEEFRANLSQYRGRLKWMVSSDNMNWDTLALETSDLFDMVPSKHLQLVDNKEPAVLYYKVQVDLENLCAAQYSRVREIIEYPKLDGHIDIIQDCDYVSLGSSVEDNKYGIVEIHANADSRHTIFDKWYESENNLDYFPNEEGETIVLEDVEIKDLWYIAEFTNGIGCVHTDSVSVNNCPIPLVDIPTAITDNDDGANETFFVDKLRFYPENKIRIYNRWGTMVYEKIGYDNEWEAIVDGEELPIGTYYYVLDLNNKENTSYQGYVTVVRP